MPDLYFIIKRKEENIKYALNWCFKFLESKFALHCSSDSRLSFYVFYFKNTSSDFQIRFQEFYKPTFARERQNAQRSYNEKYLTCLRLSPNFMEDMGIAFDYYYKEEQRQLIRKKLEIIFHRLHNFVIANGNTELPFDELLLKFSQKSKFHFPWAYAQAVDAREVIKSVVLEH